MSMSLINRREFLTYPLVLLFATSTRAMAGAKTVKAAYTAEIGILYDMFSLQLRGTIEETIDRIGGEYRIVAHGTGPGIANRLNSVGVLRDGRWAPLRSHSWFDVRGRESRTDISYHWAKRQIEYHARGETFFLRRLRVVDDVVSVPDRLHVDDVMSATLNYADGRWPAQTDGIHRTFVVRRRRSESEGPDDVAPAYRAETVPLELKIAPDPSGKVTALFDLTRFSSWARPSKPARIYFSETRRPELIVTSMILGTSATIRFIASDA